LHAVNLLIQVALAGAVSVAAKNDLFSVR
jgi:hypothetical protein